MSQLQRVDRIIRRCKPGSELCRRAYALKLKIVRKAASKCRNNTPQCKSLHALHNRLRIIHEMPTAPVKRLRTPAEKKMVAFANAHCAPHSNIKPLHCPLYLKQRNHIINTTK